MSTTNETNLEQVFSDIAYSALRDQSQALLDYLVGFEMLKQEDDGARAVGIFGFEIDSQFYYSPVFFLNGEIRGLDSIYSVQSDKFYPLTEPWVNELINRRSQSLGEADRRSSSEAGVRFPNYTRLKVVPGHASTATVKLGSAQEVFTKMAGESEEFPTLSLPQALQELNKTAEFKVALDQYPRLMDAVTTFYNVLDFADVEQPQTKVASEAAKPVVVISSITDEGVDNLNDSQRKTLLEGGVVVLDDRPEVDKAMVFSSEPKIQLTNPEGGGLFDVLWADGEVMPAVICPTGDTTNKVIVYRKDTGQHGFFDRRNILTVRKYDSREWREWLEKEGKPAEGVRPGQTIFFISDTGEGTGAFCVDEVNTGLDDIKRYSVHDPYYMSSLSYPSMGGRGNNGNPPQNQYFRMWIGGANRPESPICNVREILVTKMGAPSAKYNGEQLVVNKEHFRCFQINSFDLTSAGSKSPADTYWDEEYSKKRRNILLKESDFGDYNTLRNALWKSAEAVDIWRDGPEVVIRKKTASAQAFTKTAALVHLLDDYAMGESDARMLIDDARSTPSTYFVQAPQTKIAAQLLELPQINDASDGGFMSAYHKQVVPFSAESVASSPFNRDYYGYQSPFGPGGHPEGGDGNTGTLEMVDRAAQTGQKDVFDAAALASLIQSYRPTELIDRFLPTIVSGMDRLGRMLFLIYWHYEDFAERYGENDLQEFIDNLKTVFEQLGDVILFAKKKTLAGDPEHYGLNVRPSMEAGE